MATREAAASFRLVKGYIDQLKVKGIGLFAATHTETMGFPQSRRRGASFCYRHRTSLLFLQSAVAC